MINKKPSFNSESYQKARPSTPAEIIDYLKNNIPSYKKAWDCGTGNGQTAIKLAEFIDKIHATDISKDQISKAFKHKNIKYFESNETSSMFNDESVDLVTASQAAHWFDISKFEKECLRILKPNGIIAIWTYYRDIQINGKTEVIYQEFLNAIDSFFPEGNGLVEIYQSINLNLPMLNAPKFEQTKQMDFDNFIEYLKSISAYAEYIKNHRKCPLIELGFYDKFRKSWGEPSTINTITWPIVFKCYIKR
ncbi:class I SAM-dependent methyltransferase [Francisella sp. LA112445]|uniref:class I SAM-dependent methyltransferase n=1 Tax=Francisella sp. LA112445 TaxID=1395624 RepID=UPI001788C912|nr:class I SAM-dependent methyltransferase [Francisella sp. LA112445]QIW10391.1 class I SAM-dependent methyltransferase [Francisella sp. LA112445]